MTPWAACEALLGLSPRLRGNLRAGRLPQPRDRSIPAPAGEPVDKLTLYDIWWVYPRACGGTPARTLPLQRREGLSPRLRGNRQARGARGKPSGSIPAPAGEPRVRWTGLHHHQVYPRACGGTAQGKTWLLKNVGLSPRLRGNLRYRVIRRAAERSIPAPAGEPSP